MSLTENITPSHIDIENAKWEFENKKISLVKIAEKYGRNSMYWSRLSRELGWIKYEIVNDESLVTKDKNAEGQKTKAEVVFVDPHNILTVVAARKVNEVMEELGDNYSPMDEPLIMAYGVLYQEFLRLASLVSIEGDLVENDKGVTYTNPRYNNFLAIIERMAKLGDRFGMSVVSRKRAGIMLGKRTEQKGFWDMLENVSVSVDS